MKCTCGLRVGYRGENLEQVEGKTRKPRLGNASRRRVELGRREVLRLDVLSSESEVSTPPHPEGW